MGSDAPLDPLAPRRVPPLPLRITEVVLMSRDSIRALVDAATPGPWYSEPASRVLPARVGAEGHLRGVGDYAFAFLDDSARPEQGGAEWDAAFIAASRTAVPLLLAVADAAAAEMVACTRCVLPSPCASHRATEAALSALEAA